MTPTHLDLDRIDGLAGRLRESGTKNAPRNSNGVYMSICDEAADALTAMITRIREVEGQRPAVSIKTMKLSDGREDHYVSVQVGDREITPSCHRIKGRSEYEVAEWNWLLNGGEKPNMMDWLDRTRDPDEPALQRKTP